MKQVLLSGKGEISVVDVPTPAALGNCLLVRNAYSLISTGTESAAVARRHGWLGAVEKACASGDRMAKVWRMARHNGLQHTWAAVRGRLDDWTAIGYSCCGQVVDSHGEAAGFAPGDWVACLGTGYANHAEYVAVPTNLAVKLPQGVAAEEASFGAVACVAEHGIRNLELTPGEVVLVLGLGLVGTLAAVLARAMGYAVFGLDLAPQRADHCQQQFGITSWSDAATTRTMLRQLTDGRGVDGVVLSAATASSEPVNLAFDLCRARGRVAVVGDVGLSLIREKMYRKEISVRVSCSYGPGRYDAGYEVEGRDYPVGHVRWTERRNLEYFLRVLAEGRVSVRPLISREFSIDEATSAYSLVKQGGPATYGVLLKYADASPTACNVPLLARTVRTAAAARPVSADAIRLGLIGCGGFARHVHLPNLGGLERHFHLAAVASRSGATAAVAARRFGIPLATSDHRAVLDDPQIDAVLISTRHASHASLALEALEAGKHVFVDKPLCLTVEEGSAIVTLAERTGLVVRVGFNRRFAPYLGRLRDAIGTSGPRLFTCRVLVSSAQLNHWSNTPAEGGRFLGEAVHFLDLCNWFVGGRPNALHACALGDASATNPNLLVSIGYPDGSAANVAYTTLGHAGLGKEYYEAHGNGRSATCHDLRRVTLHGGRCRFPRSERGDKGHLHVLTEFASAVRGEISTGGPGADATSGLLATWMAQTCLASAAAEKLAGQELELDAAPAADFTRMAA